ncbi:hypothetical protein F4556_002954 [Kitasatospora gansuensis]|uniref:Uncharacterized protein n=1 Tax=Kitasatospora gansuensis TaxID=258050 RepID=A0A7W7SBF5_9ACTN|nr:hypothetical protein [Kitasatospora gansuensis]MBB4947419.1 hypothetical protein [Kitasatospora gansuensis]
MTTAGTPRQHDMSPALMRCACLPGAVDGGCRTVSCIQAARRP